MKGLGLVVLAVILVITSILGLGALAFGDHTADDGALSESVEVASLAEAELADVSDLVQICDIDGSCGLIAAELLEPVTFEPLEETAAVTQEAIGEIAAVPEPLQMLSPEGILLVQLCDPADSTGCSWVPAILLEPVEIEVALEELAAEIAAFEEAVFEEALARSLELIAMGLCEPATGECIPLPGEILGEVAVTPEQALPIQEGEMVLYCDPDGTCGMIDALLLAEFGLEPVMAAPAAEVAAVAEPEAVVEAAPEMALEPEYDTLYP